MIIGIDLGTTNSLAAYWKDGAAHLIPNALGQILTPSCVSIDADGTVLVGAAAKARLQTHPDRTAALFKRHMGSDKQFALAGRALRPEELSALVLRALKEDAEAHLGTPVTEAIISVPAYFSDAQRRATRAAGQLAGLHVERLVNEPTAAALSYGLHQRASESQFLVFDLGGGTFDVSLLELFEGVMEVRATAGDNFLGGEDFLGLIVEWFFDATGVPERARREAGFMEHLTAQAEIAKRQLTEDTAATLAIEWNGKPYSAELSQSHYQSLCEPLLARLRAPLERTLRDAGIASGEVDEVVLAGGATRMPMIRNLVTRLFGRFPATSVNPDEVVALGAAVLAAMKSRNQDLREVVMTDVCPYSLGVAVTQFLPGGHQASGVFSPIIERNTVVPVSRSHSYVPLNATQAELKLEIYQGESRLVNDNIALGELTVPIQKGAQDNGVDVRFTYDVNGILEVQAERNSDRQQFRVVIRGNQNSMSDAEIEARLQQLAHLKIHPRDKQENRTLLAEAESAYAFSRGTERDALSVEIGLFENVLAGQDERAIAQARERLAQAIRYMERSKVFAPPDEA
ncbi:Hsp70 family protein [Pseudomonadota bacterium AL_CKDN230030165-1A_HGKHYDSX7]